MPNPCKVCIHPRRLEIEEALEGGASLRSLAATFGVGRTALRNHASTHTTAMETRERQRAAKGRPRRKKPAPAVDLKPIENKEDVLADYQWARVEARDLFEQAKGRNDWKSAERQFDRVLESIDRFAKVFGMLQADGTTVNVDRSTKILNVLGAMTEEQLRELLGRSQRGETIALPEVAGASS